MRKENTVGRASRAARRISPSVWMDRGYILSPNALDYLVAMVAEGWLGTVGDLLDLVGRKIAVAR